MSVSAACSPFLLRAFAVMNDVAYLGLGGITQIYCNLFDGLLVSLEGFPHIPLRCIKKAQSQLRSFADHPAKVNGAGKPAEPAVVHGPNPVTVDVVEGRVELVEGDEVGSSKLGLGHKEMTKARLSYAPPITERLPLVNAVCP